MENECEHSSLQWKMESMNDKCKPTQDVLVFVCSCNTFVCAACVFFVHVSAHTYFYLWLMLYRSLYRYRKHDNNHKCYFWV